MRQDTVRVLRIVEYVGPRDKVESQVERSIQGIVCPPNSYVEIAAATIGSYPEILHSGNEHITEKDKATLNFALTELCASDFSDAEDATRVCNVLDLLNSLLTRKGWKL